MFLYLKKRCCESETKPIHHHATSASIAQQMHACAQISWCLYRNYIIMFFEAIGVQLLSDCAYVKALTRIIYSKMTLTSVIT